MKKDIKFRMLAYTDAAGKYTPGAPANGNEDNFYVDDNLGDDVAFKCVADKIDTLSDCGCLMVVADGMGGMNAGEVASKIAIDTVSDYFAPGKITPQMAASARDRKNYLESVIVEADNRIKKDSKHHEEHRGMGSTIILAWIVGDELTLSWCGDSRAYRYNDANGIELLSKDHSYVQELVDKGIITYEDSFEHPQGNIVTNSLGDTDMKARPESRQFKVYNGDIILLCSDGLSGVLRDKKVYTSDGMLLPGDTLEDVIAANHNSLKECREALWVAAEKADWYDNVTAVLCEVISGAETYPEKKETAAAQSMHKTNNIRMSKKTLTTVILAVLMLLIGAVGATWFFASNTTGKKTESSEKPTVVKEDSKPSKPSSASLPPEVYTRQSELLGRVNAMNKKFTQLPTDKLKQEIENATDEEGLDDAEKKVALLEEKFPAIMEVAKELNGAKGDKKEKLRELLKEIVQSEKVTTEAWGKKLKTIVATDEKQSTDKKQKQDKENKDKNGKLNPTMELTPVNIPSAQEDGSPISNVPELRITDTNVNLNAKEKEIKATITGSDTNYGNFKKWIENDNPGYEVVSIFYKADNEMIAISNNRSLIHAQGKQVTIKLRRKK